MKRTNALKKLKKKLGSRLTIIKSKMPKDMDLDKLISLIKDSQTP